MASKEEQHKKKKTHQDLDSILDAALDELEDDSDHDNCDDYKEVSITNALDQNVDDGSGPSQPLWLQLLNLIVMLRPWGFHTR
mmetsp:Transcript_24692/g.36568  ORF Transcript_24692/g.36568 Transcript_24692/m.36568 type:complete len:83 (-) Transcript_24692:243-491(-)